MSFEEIDLIHNPNEVVNVEKLKLFKNAKSNNWEIQLCCAPGKCEELLPRLEKLNEYMQKKYGTLEIQI